MKVRPSDICFEMGDMLLTAKDAAAFDWLDGEESDWTASVERFDPDAENWVSVPSSDLRIRFFRVGA